MAKPKFIISTTGTSIGTNVRRNIFSPNFDDKNVLEEIRKSIDKKNVEVISAETKSLNKIGVDTSTRIAFIHTDTREGELCADVLMEWCLRTWQCFVSIDKVKALQVTDAELFAKEGIKEYLKLCMSLIEKHRYSHDVVLNPTGGFKGIVPYTTIVGMIFSIPIYYIFEGSNTLIRLPSIPLNYDAELMDNCAEKLKHIEDETFIKEHEFWGGIEFYERERFLSLVEIENGVVSLSPIGLLLWERYKKDFPPHLKKSSKKPEDKEIHLRDDPGKDVLMHWAKRFVNSPYVEGIINSLPFNPRATEPVKTISDDGLIELVLTKTDKGCGMVIKTTGRNKKETEEIVKIIRERYGF